MTHGMTTAAMMKSMNIAVMISHLGLRRPVAMHEDPSAAGIAAEAAEPLEAPVGGKRLTITCLSSSAAESRCETVCGTIHK